MHQLAYMPLRSLKLLNVMSTAGKTTFLKALSCQLNKSAGHLEGQILYNGDSVDSGKYLVGKITSYVDERDQHAPTLTVRETMEFAWRCTTGGHHSYNVARDEKSAEVLNRGDATLIKVLNR
jgi:ABC-type multidrug transport system ATPase subunit